MKCEGERRGVRVVALAPGSGCSGNVRCGDEKWSLCVGVCVCGAVVRVPVSARRACVSASASSLEQQELLARWDGANGNAPLLVSL